MPSILWLVGCDSDDDVNLDPDRRYLQRAEVLTIPAGEWDFQNGPDLRIQLKRASVDFFEFDSEIREDVEAFPLVLSFGEEILATDENYDLILFDEDEDENDNDDIVCQFRFNPTTDGGNGEIVLTKDGEAAIVIFYDER